MLENAKHLSTYHRWSGIPTFKYNLNKGYYNLNDDYFEINEFFKEKRQQSLKNNKKFHAHGRHRRIKGGV